MDIFHESWNCHIITKFTHYLWSSANQVDTLSMTFVTLNNILDKASIKMDILDILG
jgi:hypothetical protein